MPLSLPIHGRGAIDNPANRFEPITIDVDGDYLDAVDLADRPDPRTQIFRDMSRSIIATNDSPDIPFDASINVYRGCEHGCSYCFARPFHEYLGLSAGVDFETKIFAKMNAPELLRAELSKRSWQPKAIVMSGVTDPYQPIERKLRLTRQLLEVFAAFRNPVALITKNALITRDLDLLSDLARDKLAMATITMTTLDPKLGAVMEPRASSPARRLEAIRKLSAAGVPVGLSVSPVIPGLTDHEVPAILRAAREAGARHAFSVSLRLPGAVKDVFLTWLRGHFPDRYEKVVNRQLEAKRGQLNDAQWGRRMTADGEMAGQIEAMFRLQKARLGYTPYEPLSTEKFAVPGGQLRLF